MSREFWEAQSTAPPLSTNSRILPVRGHAHVLRTDELHQVSAFVWPPFYALEAWAADRARAGLKLLPAPGLRSG